MARRASRSRLGTKTWPPTLAGISSRKATASGAARTKLFGGVPAFLVPSQDGRRVACCDCIRGS
ncbi:hypothetical protein [Streptomyces sp. 3N207]|uniref:hypothetical protein n=1 Tax=Streptomyces sp. 3N207 TaxID=3457417 RepID=UPI003FD45FE3